MDDNWNSYGTSCKEVLDQILYLGSSMPNSFKELVQGNIFVFPKLKRASKVKKFQKVTAFIHALELNTIVKKSSRSA
jgi:hypothetical protein